MIALDSNILIYAFSRESEWYLPCRTLFLQQQNESVTYGIPVFCLGEFIRVVTHPRLYPQTARLEQALVWLNHMMTSPHLRIMTPGPAFPSLFLNTIRASAACGNLVFDAQIVALCREHNVDKLITYDQDFARFPDLNCMTPETLLKT